MDREEISIRDVSVTIHVVDFKSEPRAMPREMALQFASQKMYLCTISVFRKRRIDWLIWIVSGIENWEKWKYGIENGKDGNMKTVLNMQDMRTWKRYMKSYVRDSLWEAYFFAFVFAAGLFPLHTVFWVAAFAFGCLGRLLMVNVRFRFNYWC